MKKILITVSVLMTMSFTNKLWNYDLVAALDKIEDCREWMMQDVKSGRIESKLGELYIESFTETINHIKNVDRVIIHTKNN